MHYLPSQVIGRWQLGPIGGGDRLQHVELDHAGQVA